LEWVVLWITLLTVDASPGGVALILLIVTKGVIIVPDVIVLLWHVVRVEFVDASDSKVLEVKLWPGDCLALIRAGTMLNVVKILCVLIVMAEIENHTFFEELGELCEVFSLLGD